MFKNDNRNFPIRGTPDNMSGVANRTGPKGLIDSTVMPQYLSKKIAILSLPNGGRRILLVDNCSGHLQTNRKRNQPVL